MAQIYVNSELIKPKSIHIYNSSAQLWEEDRIGYVRVNGEWIPFVQYTTYYYNYGEINVGYPLSSVNVNMETAYITGRSNVGFVATESFDVTGLSKLFIVAEGSTGSSARVKFGLKADGVRYDYQGPFTVVYQIDNGLNFTELTTFELDISDISGDYSIVIETHYSSNFRIYQLYAE